MLRLQATPQPLCTRPCPAYLILWHLLSQGFRPGGLQMHFVWQAHVLGKKNVWMPLDAANALQFAGTSSFLHESLRGLWGWQTLLVWSMDSHAELDSGISAIPTLFLLQHNFQAAGLQRIP